MQLGLLFNAVIYFLFRSLQRIKMAEDLDIDAMLEAPYKKKVKSLSKFASNSINLNPRVQLEFLKYGFFIS